MTFEEEFKEQVAILHTLGSLDDIAAWIEDNNYLLYQRNTYNQAYRHYRVTSVKFNNPIYHTKILHTRTPKPEDRRKPFEVYEKGIVAGFQYEGHQRCISLFKDTGIRLAGVDNYRYIGNTPLYMLDSEFVNLTVMMKIRNEIK